MPQPSAGQRLRDWLAVVAEAQVRPGHLAVATGATQPLGEEGLLPRLTPIQVPSEQRAQLIVVFDPLIQLVNQPVDGRLTTDAFKQVGTAEGSETRRVPQEAAVLKTGAGTRR